jgi:predicted amidophosphoribosyltransferase
MDSHQRLRESYRRRVEAGEETCVRCFLPIPPLGGICPQCGREVVSGRAQGGFCSFDLDHDDLDRSRYLGPSHSCCNRIAGAKNAAKKLHRSRRIWSRAWLEE